MELGVGVVGLGIGEQHARAFAASGRCRLRWLYDIDAGKARQLAAALPVDRVAEDFAQLLDDRTVQIVSIASYDGAHAAQVIAALEAGKHVFVEKPLCRSMSELCAVRNAWLKHGAPHLMSNLVLRAAPVYVWLQDAIASGDLGTVYAVDADYLYGRLEKITGGWRGQVKDYSVMLGGGIHMVDLMMRLSAQKPVSVRAVGNRICTQESGFQFNDYQSAVFVFSSSVIGRITANYGCVHAHQHVLRVFGTSGTFLNDDCGPRLHLSRDPGVAATPISHTTLPRSKGDLLPSFIDNILDGHDSAPAAKREFDLISACVAADRASASGEEVSIQYL